VPRDEDTEVRTRPNVTSWIAGLAIAAGLWTTGRASAQTPAQTPPAQPAQTQPAAQTPPVAAPAPPPAEIYSYDPGGRRDPFVSLVARGTDLRPDNRPQGLGGMLINDITVRGIFKSEERIVAMLQAPDNRTYIVHVNDKLFDGFIKAITVDTVVFSQDVNDPLSLVKQREVRKPIRPLQEGK